jgi:hypothetical protein
VACLRYAVRFGGPSLDGSGSDVRVEMTIVPKKLMERIHLLGESSSSSPTLLLMLRAVQRRRR